MSEIILASFSRHLARDVGIGLALGVPAAVLAMSDKTIPTEARGAVGVGMTVMGLLALPASRSAAAEASHTWTLGIHPSMARAAGVAFAVSGVALLAQSLLTQN